MNTLGMHYEKQWLCMYTTIHTHYINLYEHILMYVSLRDILSMYIEIQTIYIYISKYMYCYIHIEALR